MNSIQRTERALSLIPFLAQNPGMSIQEIAARFGATPAEISSELEVIFMCGLPGYTHLELIDLSMDDGFVTLKDPQNLGQPKSMNARESIAIILGLQLLLPIAPDKESAQGIQSLIEKLKSITPHIPVPNVYKEIETPTVSIKDLQKAILNQNRITFNYVSESTKVSKLREIFPLSLSVINDKWILAGHEYDSGIVKYFRLDRIDSLAVGEKSPKPDLHQNRTVEVTARISSNLRFFTEQHSSIVKDIKQGELLTVKFQVENIHWLLTALSKLPGKVEVISPTYAKEDFQRRHQALLSLYDKV